MAQHAWEESTLLSYLAEGQDKFCEDTGFFVDITNYSITLSDGVAVYAIPDRAIQVLEVFDGTRKLGKFQEEDRPASSTTWNPSTSTAATPTAWQADRASGYITFNNTPTAADVGKVFQLQVWRYSQFALDDDDIDGALTPASPEIPQRFHRGAVNYAAYAALMHHDEEQQDPVKASEHLTIYERYATEGKRFFRRNHGIRARVGVNAAYVV